MRTPNTMDHIGFSIWIVGGHKHLVYSKKYIFKTRWQCGLPRRKGITVTKQHRCCNRCCKCIVTSISWVPPAIPSLIQCSFIKCVSAPARRCSRHLGCICEPKGGRGTKNLCAPEASNPVEWTPSVTSRPAVPGDGGSEVGERVGSQCVHASFLLPIPLERRKMPYWRPECVLRVRREDVGTFMKPKGGFHPGKQALWLSLFSG